MLTPIRNFLLALFLCSTVVSHAGTEKLVTSLCGRTGFQPIVVPTSGASLEIRDQWYDYMQANDFASGSGRWDDIFRVQSAKTRVVLRYDDAQHYAPANPWVIRITYDITTFDSSGTTTNRTDEVLEITYDPASGTTYTDRAVNQYTDAHKGSITIVTVEYWDDGNTAGASEDELPTELKDVYLDLEVEIERYYYLDNTAPDVQRYSNTTDNTLWLGWDYIQGAESYDVEWLFIDAGTESLSNDFNYDWKNATRVNVADNHYQIELAYPKGILLTRVRPVGVDYRNFIDNEYVTRYDGTWSYATETGTTNTDATALTAANARTNITTGREEDLNWQYSASFAEDGKRKDAISFYDGSLYGRQTVTRSNTDSTLIVAEARYDSEGRAAVQILPTPVVVDATDNILRYQQDFNPGFDLADFDYDATMANPNRIDTTGNATGEFYSGTNTSTDRGQQFSATTGGYAYTQVQFKNDGTNRPAAEGGIGPNHKIGSGHEVRYYYGTPTGQVELDRLFGNEVGYVEHYQKNLVVDPNGVVSVAYLDQEGRVIATALGGDCPDSLMPLDYTDYDPVPITADLLGNNDLNNNGEKVSHSTITVVGTDVEYAFEYNLSADTACGGDCYDVDPCPDCKYDLTILVTYENGDAVTPLSGSNPIVATNIGSASHTFTMELSTGVYHVTKTIKLNEGYIEDLREAFISAQLHGEGCTDLVDTDPEPCAIDCEEACEILYKRAIEGEENEYTYYNLDGDYVGSSDDENTADDAGLEADAQEYIENCVASLCGAQAMPDPCELRYNNMVLDMSDGGQYFDNAPDKYIPDDGDSDGDGDDEELILNPGYDENEWLENHYDETAMLAAINAVWAGTDFTTWDEVRDNWDESWGAILVEFHPEYCAWEYYCEHGCEVEIPDHDPVVITHEMTHEYDQLFYYSTDGNYPGTSSATPDEYELFNPTNIAEVDDYTTNDVDEDHSTYQPYNQIGLGSIYTTDHFVVDPYMLCNWEICEDSASRARLNHQLKNFLPLYDGSDVLITGEYHSIWYVIEDPEDIHLGTPGSTGLSQNTIDFYVALHGDGTDPGALTTAGGDITPFQFFAGVYGYYRQLVIEQGFEYSSTTNGESVYECQEEHFGTPYGHVETEEPASPVTATGFTVYFPENAVLNLHGDGCASIVYGMPSGMDEYIDELDGQYADEENEIVSTYTNRADCSCDNLHAWIVANDLETELGLDDWTAITVEINMSLDYCTAVGHTGLDYTEAEVESWFTECDEEEPDFDDFDDIFFPEDLLCPPETTIVDATNVNELLQDECEAENGALANMNDSIIIYQQIYALTLQWETYYRNTCLQKLEDNETFTVEYTLQEYQYTLYYYDQAGTLVKTVPPEGVKIITLTNNRDPGEDAITDGEEIEEWRDHWRDHAYDGTALPTDVDYTPAIHGMVTNYQYNSLQQPVESVSPDITAETKFFYDPLGRLIVSQDARQRDLATDAWSYIIYDDLGRIEESGEIINSTAMTETIARATTGTDYDAWLLLGSQKQQVVRTQYETSLTGVAALFPNAVQKNTRNRVTSITWEAVDDADNNTYDNASHFSYDIHGNVDYLVQYNKQLEDIEQDVKHIRYEYDLISGNVKSVHYQEGGFDEFHHGYLYDADNRVTTSYTWRGPLLSNAVETWEKEQKNFYYLTGPLMRQEIGDKTVQAMDYAYTAQGWIKVMNAGSVSSTRDMGRDAYSENISGATSTNMYTALDASGFVLNYFSSDNRNGDYWAPAITTAGSANAYVPNVTSNATRDDYHNLYNGNIASMVTSLTDETETIIDNQITAYRYDQLNRIKYVRAHRNYNTSTNAFAGASGNDGKYGEDFIYDRNGNIFAVTRNGNNTGGTQLMDEFEYKYYDNTGAILTYGADGMPLDATNKLAGVDDVATAGNYATDIDDQGSMNYEYDGNGNLVHDESEQIETIEWYANGKIKKIERESTSSRSDLEFIYDASGNRIIKITKPRDGTGVLSQLHWTMTYYVRDASGNVMGVYTRTFTEDEGENDIFYDNFKNSELHIYGSKRVGTNNVDSLLSFAFEDSDFMDSYGDYFDQPDYDPISGSSPCADHCKTNHRRELGNKQYEVTNHLGNVLATVSDRRLSEDAYSYTTWSSGTKYALDAVRNIYYINGSGTFQRTPASSDNRADWYTADVISYSDYYAFGAQMDGRNGGQYRYDFNGKETDPESDLQDYGMRIYNARLGKFLSVDPITSGYPELTPYQFAINRPVDAIDHEGLYGIPLNYTGVGLSVSIFQPKLVGNNESKNRQFSIFFQHGTLGSQVDMALRYQALFSRHGGGKGMTMCDGLRLSYFQQTTNDAGPSPGTIGPDRNNYIEISLTWYNDAINTKAAGKAPNYSVFNSTGIELSVRYTHYFSGGAFGDLIDQPWAHSIEDSPWVWHDATVGFSLFRTSDKYWGSGSTLGFSNRLVNGIDRNSKSVFASMPSGIYWDHEFGSGDIGLFHREKNVMFGIAR